MEFDDDVLSALEEAFGAGSASLMDGLDLEEGQEAGEDFPEDLPAVGASLDDLVFQVDQEILDSASQEPRADRPRGRSRSIDDKHVLVLAGDTYYALPLKNILEIQQLPKVTYLPHLPDWIPGVCNLRGNIVSIVDLKQLLGFEPTAIGPKTRLVVVRTDSQDLTTGLIVDEVARITEVEPARVRRPAGPLEGQLGGYIKGTYETGDAVICILDLETTLNSPTLRLG